AQDDRRLGGGDTGPNTGGMGTYCPVSRATPGLYDRVQREVIAPVLAALARRGTPYRGVLYAGLMIAPGGRPLVLEFNCRLGDPEAQAVLPLVPGVTRHLLEIATGGWRPDAARLEPLRAAVATVLAAPGYPERPELGAAIEIPRDLEPGTLVFHAGTARGADGTLRVAGGRVLTVTALGATVAEAAQRSRAACERIAFPGKVYRRDIGWRELPEVETIVRELAPRLEGRRIARARLAKTDVLRRVSKPRLLRTLAGNAIDEVSRRAKHAVFRLASGHRLVVQPRMTGALIVYDRPLGRDDAKYAVLTCTLDDGRVFVYRDVRRLGTVWLLDERGWAAYTARLGPEPLEPTFT